ncbi:MAG: bifunctional precorrin-2 dehydrogenase/sirohydrochlorin ferrochelatase [Rectinemataceae bacterium]
MNRYPISLDLCGRKVLIVGGGRVACRKVKDLIEVGAEITVVSPNVDFEIAALLEAGRIRHEPRKFEVADLAGCFLVIAAASDRAVNAEVGREALRADMLVNVVDDAGLSNFTTPAKVRRGDLLLTASTNGKSPALSREIRKKLERAFGEEYAAYLDFMGELRTIILDEIEEPREREAIFGSLTDFGLVELFSNDRALFRKSLGEILPARLMVRIEERHPMEGASRAPQADERAAGRHRRYRNGP